MANLYSVSSAMKLSSVEKSLLLAAYFRGGSRDQQHWTSNSDQIVTLSLFYTGDIASDECCSRFSYQGYVGNLYDEEGELLDDINSRYELLIELLRKRPQLIDGGGNFETPAYPTFTACRLSDEGLRMIPEIADSFPQKPDFPNWPDERLLSDVE